MDNALKAQISKLMTDATSDENAGNRTDLFDRYMAEPYGDEVKGRSQFLDSAVADAVEAILPDVMDVFTSSDDILEFSPVGPEDEDGAKQETDVVSHIFWQKNKGFENLYVWIKEALIQQNSYIWRGWVEKERITLEEYEDLTFEELVGITTQLEGEYEFLEQSGFDVLKDNETGNPIPIPSLTGHDEPEPINVKIRIVNKSKEYLIEPFPQEDFFITPRWSTLGLDGVPCCGRRHRDKRKEDLVALGFTEASIDKLGKTGIDDEAKDARHHTKDLSESEADDDSLEVYEAYLLVDLNDDGTNVLVQMWGSEDGGVVLETKDGKDAIEEVSSIPISALTPYLMSHRHVGRSVSEQVDDIQKVNTVLIRQMLDNIYLTNYSRPAFDENSAGPNTYTDLASPNPGSPIRTGGALIDWQAPPPIAGNVLPLLEKFSGLKEERVGATRYNQGLDAESLNKTMGGMKMIMNASQKKTKLIARTIAETGLRDLFMGIHRDLRAGPMKELVLKLRGKWEQIDPRTWKNRTDMNVNVGMGRGDRDEVRQGLFQLGQVQREMMASGSRMVDDQKIFNTVSRIADTFGISNIDNYINNPASMPPSEPEGPPPPDPVMMSVQAQTQKQQADAEFDRLKLEKDHEFRMAELQMKQVKVASDIQSDEEKLDLEKDKAVMKDDLERDKLEIEAETAFLRDEAKVVSSEPPISYDEVTQD